MMKHLRQTGSNQKAFTIIELMIATAVLSTILILVTSMMIGIGSLYYKGVNQARIQDDVRVISDDVSQHLKLSDSVPLAAPPAADGTSAYCIGDTRYTYMLNKQIGSAPGQTPHVLWRDSNPSPNSCVATVGFLGSAVPSPSGTELITPNSRLTDFTMSLSSPYSLSIGAAYGDDNLLNLSGLNTTCLGSIGDQFCSTATLTTVVIQRVNGG